MGTDKESGYSRDGRRAVQQAGVEDRRGGSSEAAVDAELAMENAAYTLQNQKGYFRIGAGDDGMVWARWKWTKGALAGRYVFAKCDTLGRALQEVCLNASEVIEGKRVAALDRAP